MTCRVSTYIGFSNILTHDFVKCFTSDFFQNACSKFGVINKEVPCESHNSLGSGERYHAPLRRIYMKWKLENTLMHHDVTLSVAVHGLNNTANPKGLIPNLLVFGTMAKIATGLQRKERDSLLRKNSERNGSYRC